MYNILDRFGLYDFFGLLIPGSWFWIMLYFIEYPIRFEYVFFKDETYGVVVFILLSYVTGTLIQEIGSFFFRNLREYPKNNFLKIESKIFRGEELKAVQKYANKELTKEKRI